MINLTIDNRSVTVPAGTTVLEAARQLNIEIPTLCYLDGCETFTSCMVCVVQNVETGRLIPSCSVRVSEGMIIDTESECVRTARKDTLDMLLSEHVGDCEAPCTRTCPAHMNIPQMIRQIQKGDWAEAIKTVKRDIALPAVLGRICPAPCEAGCNRKQHDGALSICLLKRKVADLDLEQDVPYNPEIAEESGKCVAVVGAGPTGLAAAYYLAIKGHSVTLYEQSNQAGGQLRAAELKDKLPEAILNLEIDQIFKLNITFVPDKKLGKDIHLNTLQKDFNAVVLAIGVFDPVLFNGSNLELTEKGITVDRKTYETNLPGVFAGGNAIGKSNRAIRAVAHGKEMAWAVDQYIRNKTVIGEPMRFDSRMGKLLLGEIDSYLVEGSDSERLGSDKSGFSDEKAVQEALRCFHCDCRKPDTCKLRLYGTEYGAEHTRFKIGPRSGLVKMIQPGHVIYEPGKCIKCGLCIQIAKAEGETLGLTFVGRGFNVRVAVPFNETLEKGLTIAANKCVEACPTAALSVHEKIVG